MEEWRPVVGYDGWYEVSSLGRVRSVDRVIHDGRRYRGRLLKQTVTRHCSIDYFMVGLSRNGKVTPRTVHSIVAEAFLGPRPEGCEVRHGPGGSLDNSVANLSYGTRAENMADTVRDGTRLTCEKHPHAVLTEDLVREIRSTPSISGCEWARILGMSRSTITQVRRRETWKSVR